MERKEQDISKISLFRQGTAEQKRRPAFLAFRNTISYNKFIKKKKKYLCVLRSSFFVKHKTGKEARRRTAAEGVGDMIKSGGAARTVQAFFEAYLVSVSYTHLTCIFVDTGCMRKNEGDEVMQALHQEFAMNVIRVNAGQRFLGRLKGVTEPEEKRKIIGDEFIKVFDEEAAKLGKMDFLLQGTIYPDVIESGAGEAATIKSHHNVGGLPEEVGFEIIEPLRMLFKDEVRALGRALGLPDYMVNRQPFPGPGLAIRCLGEVREDKLFLIRESDAILREEIARAGLDRSIWQYFTLLPNVQSVGVMGDGRTYSHCIAIRAVCSTDGMTSEWAKIPYDVLERISSRIVNEVPGVNRIVYDVTTKPPATIEWE